MSQNKTQEIILSNIYMHFYETLEESGIFCLGWQKWDVLSRVKNQYGIFCPPCQISVGCFVHLGEVVWDLSSTLQKMAWELLSMTFIRLPPPPTCTSLPNCRMCLLRTYERICLYSLYTDLCWQFFKNDWYSAGKKTERLICKLLCSLYNDCDNLVSISIKAKISKDVQQPWRIQCNAGGGGEGGGGVIIIWIMWQ